MEPSRPLGEILDRIFALSRGNIGPDADREICREIKSLFDFPDKGEFLKRIAVALESVLSGRTLFKNHYYFLGEVVAYLRAGNGFGEEEVRGVYHLMDVYGLEKFRGVLQ